MLKRMNKYNLDNIENNVFKLIICVIINLFIQSLLFLYLYIYIILKIIYFN